MGHENFRICIGLWTKAHNQIPTLFSRQLVVVAADLVTRVVQTSVLSRRAQIGGDLGAGGLVQI
jgi:hypothetical protein